MRAQDLRTGNYVQGVSLSIPREGVYSDGITKVTPFGIYQLEQGLMSDWKGIPLTEEWLLKLGFEKYQWTDACYIPFMGQHLMIRFYHGKILITTTKVTRDSRGQKMSFSKPFLPDNTIKYVHQLQNLYFSLTNEELIIKP